jgi:hypothetical protein
MKCVNMHVVMKQGVSNAQGPDIFVLTYDNKKTYLDMYQVKNRRNKPDSQELCNWLYSLGVDVALHDSPSGYSVVEKRNPVQMKRSAAYTLQVFSCLCSICPCTLKGQ